MRFLSLLLLPLALAAAAAPTPARAGELAPGLAALLAERAPDDPVRVLVVLREQVDAPALARELRLAKARGTEVHREVVTALQRTAAREQAPLVAELAAAKAAGGIRAWHPHWLVNALVVSGTVAGVRALADHPQVARIEPDLVVEPIAPVATRPAPAAKAAGVEDGVEVVNAPRVWHELAIDGTGVVVGIIDSGVDGLHPALAARWRGNFAPPSQCWLDAAELGDSDFPVDRRYHGTHVMGIAVGMAPGDTIGVAPGALWIASNGLNHPGSDLDFDNAVLASLEFMTDPDGDPGTSDDMPAVVHNSWGVNSSFTGYFDCDSRWWDAMDACEAAGVVLTWSVGNEGPDPETIRSPADRAASPTNAFSVGSVATLPPHAVSSFSSRGPSACGGPDAIKPEVVAPGEDIRSAYPGGGYLVTSGTSMAGPHVAGVVALMRQANPDADPQTIKQVLMDTALDLGPAGEDNDTGWGLVDAYAAVTAIKAGVGLVQGRVTDAAGGGPVAGADVRLAGSQARDVTDADGRFLMTVPAGPASVEIMAFGYAAAAVAVTVPDDGTVTADAALTALATVAVAGHVRDEDGAPLAGATVRVLDTPLAPATSDADGHYGLAVPLEPSRVWTLRATAPGYAAQDRSVTAPAAVFVDFGLRALVLEGFETGDFSALPWEMAGAAPWQVVADVAWNGLHSARAGTVPDGAASALVLAQTAAADGEVAFHLRVSSEAGYDRLDFLVDGVLRASWSGEVPWTRAAVPVAAGPHVYRWAYVKDAAGAGGADTAWIDDVELPQPEAAPLPRADVTPAQVTAAAPPGLAATARVTVANTGQADLTVRVAGLAAPAPAAAVAVPHLDLAKGEDDPRSAPDVLTAGGGPDGGGLVWMDSDQPGGPVYDWIDATSGGTAVPLDDDAVAGPFDLGFAFPWRGRDVQQVWVASDGFVAFSPAAPAHANQGIPDPAPPQDFVAPFWDDLDPSLGGAVFVRADAGRFVVQWDAVPHYGRAEVVETCQVVLHADGRCVFQYAHVGDGGGCTVGVENAAGDDGLQVLLNRDGYLRSWLALRVAPVALPAWLQAAPAELVVPAGGSGVLDLTLDAAAVPTGLHTTTLHLATDDPDHALVSLPVTFTVDDLAGGEEPPAAVAFAGAVPNPSNPTTRLHFSLPRAARVGLRVYDVSGRLVRVLVDGPRPAGRQDVRWDGRDDTGRAVASGVYFARLVSGDFRRTRSLVLLR